MAARELSSPDIAANLARVRERIERAARAVGRSPGDMRLVAVAKQMPVEYVRAAIAAGVTDVGENYVQEAEAKFAEIGRVVRWHLVGHLQRNKVKAALPIFDLIHTVDSRRLAEEISRRAPAGARVPVLLQVNTSGEASKFGLPPAAALDRAAELAQLPGLDIQGLMTIGRWDPDPQAARGEFQLLAEIFERLALVPGVTACWLSMGMSHDFEVAIEEGANLLRIGTAIFGPRPSVKR